MIEEELSLIIFVLLGFFLLVVMLLWLIKG
jgi:hypothetical protein